jgi:hypothetical protein
MHLRALGPQSPDSGAHNDESEKCPNTDQFAQKTDRDESSEHSHKQTH